MYCSSIKVAALALLAASAAAKVIVVNVGQGGFTYSPNNIKAVAGDHVEFHFFGEHTAVSGDFSKPCSPATTGFYSGQMQSKGIFSVPINNTDPIFFYCAIDGHCQGGMVGVINEGSDKLSAYKSAAANTDSSSARPTPTAAPTALPQWRRVLVGERCLRQRHGHQSDDWFGNGLRHRHGCLRLAHHDERQPARRRWPADRRRRGRRWPCAGCCCLGRVVGALSWEASTRSGRWSFVREYR
ncbi:hypothetical protein ACCO45_011676 [Purpureocillium lilacinum]|uniref:Uncharacterized protein n=1 Tax=Purpureocillium lilacinum TaxID=33203 RepID=A0ACC4DEJ0_PURLI